MTARAHGCAACRDPAWPPVPIPADDVAGLCDRHVVQLQLALLAAEIGAEIRLCGAADLGPWGQP